MDSSIALDLLHATMPKLGETLMGCERCALTHDFVVRKKIRLWWQEEDLCSFVLAGSPPFGRSFFE